MNGEKLSRKDFGPLESEVMGVVWRAGRPVAVREVVDNLNESRSEPLAYTTVMTVMSRLAEKDALSRRKSGRSYVYEANAPDAAGIAVKDVLRAYGDVAVAHFVDEARADPSLRRRLQRLLDEDDG
jgi:predicted transcriptional regulator